jgi:hypothetical protein
MKPLNLALEYLLDDLQQKSPETMKLYEEWNKGDRRESFLSLVESSLDGSRRLSALAQAIDDIESTQGALEELFRSGARRERWRWVAVDEDGYEVVHAQEPRRSLYFSQWISDADYRFLAYGTIAKLIGRPLTWDDDPIDLFTFNINSLKLEHLQ